MSDTLFAAVRHAVADRYTLERSLGTRAEAELFLARDRRLERPVVLHVLPPARSRSETGRAGFVARATQAARLGHPNIAPIHEVAEREELVWFVASFVPGRSLASLIATEGPLRPSAVARMARELAWALAYAHEQGIVHGNLGPDQVFLEDGTGRALLTGFAGSPAAGAETRGTDRRALARLASFAIRGRLPAGAAEARAALEALPSWAVRPLVDCLAEDADGPADASRRVAEALAPPTRIEIPRPLRDWLDARNPLRVVLISWSFTWIVLWLLQSGGTLDTMLLDTWGPWVLVWPLAILQLRRVLRAGFERADVLGVLDQQLRLRREEMGDRPSRRSNTALAWVVLGGLLAIGATQVDPQYVVHVPIAQFALGVIGLLILALGWQTVRTRGGPERPRDELMEIRVALWKGPLGRLTFALAGLGLERRRAAVAGFDQRPTTVILADSVRQLVRTLPASLLAQFPGVVGTADRLDRAAQALRQRVERLEQAGAGSVAAVALMQARDRHADVVTALETLRLALLAAHGGAAQIGAATRDLEDAMGIAERIQAVAAGRDEAAEALAG